MHFFLFLFCIAPLLLAGLLGKGVLTVPYFLFAKKKKSKRFIQKKKKRRRRWTKLHNFRLKILSFSSFFLGDAFNEIICRKVSRM